MKTFLHFCAALSGFAEPKTQVTEPERAVLRDHCTDAKVAVEIGYFEGGTTLLLAQHVPGTVYTIDPFRPGRLGIAYGKVIAHRNLVRHRLGNVRFIPGYSHEVAPSFQERIDFLFIDGDHSRKGAEQDWNDWLPKVCVNGIIAAHDYKVAVNSPERLGSMEFYESRLARHPDLVEVASVDCLVVFRKLR